MLRRMCKCCVRQDKSKYYKHRTLTGKVTKVTKKPNSGYLVVTKTLTCTDCGHEWSFSRRRLGS